jgi:hypothetical protein
MRIGIITFHWNYNYGAVLQAYCLRRALYSLGADEVKFINFVPPTLAHHATRGWGLTTGALFPTMQKRWKFHRFRAEHCPATPAIRTAGQLWQTFREFDAVITGSDQVWNIRLVGRLEPALFLGVPDYPQQKKISYAATFGNAGQPAALMDKAGELLKQIGSLSVRDRMSQTLVRDLTGREAQIVLDPTLLSDATAQPVPRKVPKNYILAYFVDVFSSEARAMVQTARSALNLPVVAVSVYRDMPGAELLIRNAGIEEWLYLFEQASVVITDSFHGSVFALKNKKPLYVLCGNDERASRIEDLTKAFECEHVVVRSAADFSRKVETNNVGTTHAFSIDQPRESSLQFLVSSISLAASTR